MKGIMSFGGGPQLNDNSNKPDRQSVGLFPSLNNSKRECKIIIIKKYRIGTGTTGRNGR